MPGRWGEMGARTKEEARAFIIGALRRRMGLAAVRAMARHRLRRQSDHNARARALRSLQDALGLPIPPLRIEAYDISTIQGTNTVGSMVVHEDGLPKTSEYRQFRIRTVDGQDDFASMEEVDLTAAASVAAISFNDNDGEGGERRTCPICGGEGHLPIKARYLASMNDIGGFITSRRRRPDGWIECGHVPPAASASSALLAASLSTLRVIARIVTELEGGEPRGGQIAAVFDALASGSPVSIGQLVARVDREGWAFSAAPRRRAKQPT